MAFATTHVPPANFTAGQLADGAVFGTFLVGNFGPQPQQANVNVQVMLRFYKNLLIAQVKSGNNATMDNVDPLSVRSREYMQNLKTYPGFVGVQAFTDLLPYLATAAQLAAVGLSDQNLTLGTPTGSKIPYTQDANGSVTPYVDPVATQLSLNNAIVTLANKTGTTPSLAAGLTTTGTSADGTTTTSPNWKNIIMYSILGLIVIVGAIWVMKSMGKGKGAGKNRPSKASYSEKSYYN